MLNDKGMADVPRQVSEDPICTYVLHVRDTYGYKVYTLPARHYYLHNHLVHCNTRQSVHNAHPGKLIRPDRNRQLPRGLSIQIEIYTELEQLYEIVYNHHQHQLSPVNKD